MNVHHTHHSPRVGGVERVELRWRILVQHDPNEANPPPESVEMEAWTPYNTENDSKETELWLYTRCKTLRLSMLRAPGRPNSATATQ